MQQAGSRLFLLCFYICQVCKYIVPVLILHTRHGGRILRPSFGSFLFFFLIVGRVICTGIERIIPEIDRGKLLKRALHIIQGGVHHGGLTPALSPRMSVISENVGKSRP